MNDPYDAPYSTKDDERDQRIHGQVHIPNTYVELNDMLPSSKDGDKDLDEAKFWFEIELLTLALVF